MKVFVKTLKGTHFEIDVKLEDTVADVKKNIETVQGTDVYPAAQQMLIHLGKVLKDGTTLEEYKVSEYSFIVIMLSKSKSSAGEASTAAAAPKAPQTSTAPAPMPPTPGVVNRGFGIEALERLLRISPAAFTPPPANFTPPAYVPLSNPASVAPSENVYGDAASNLVAGNNSEGAVQQILDMGGDTWDRDTVVRALRAAFNNPERAVEYLHSGIPEAAAVPPVAGVPPVPAVNSPMQAPQATQPAAAPTSGPNANPLNLFPQGFPYMGGNAPAGTGAGLWFLRTNPQFQAFRAMVQANPQLLQPMLQELGKRYPQLARLIQEYHADFLHLINEPVEGGDLKQWDLTER